MSAETSIATQKPQPPSEPKGLHELLEQSPYKFEFFQAVRVLMRLFVDRDPVGRQHLPKNEVVRFRAHQSTGFPASQLQSADFDTGPGRPVELTVNSMGMTGPVGALPQWYTEMVVDRLEGRLPRGTKLTQVNRAVSDKTLRDFLDLFNHRLTSLFYRAWEKYRFWMRHEVVVQQEASARQAGEAKHRGFVIDERPALDRFSQTLLDVTGNGPPALRYHTHIRNTLEPRHEIADETIRFYAGLFAQTHRSAAGLEAMLSDYFQVPVEVMQFHGQWLVLDETERTKVGQQNRLLGRDTVVGRRVWDVQSKFRIKLGPLNYRQFQRFTPVGDGYAPLTQMTRLYAGCEFDFDVELTLRKEEVPRCQIGQSGGVRAALGWNTWSSLGEYDGADPSVVLVVPEDA